MKTWLFFVLLLITSALHAQSSVIAVEENGARSKRVNIVFLSEGYTSAQMGTYATDVQTAISFLFTREPWVRYRSYCNVYRIQIASTQSGTDNGNTGGAGVQRDTYFSTGFNIPGIPQHNSIGTTGSTRAYSLLNTHVPEYDIPVVLVNDSKYGGSGGPLAVVTTNSFSPQILEHELGHSFAKLTDEYDEAYSGYPAIEFPNATTKTVRSQIRWNVWIDSTTPLPTAEGSFFSYNPLVGLYEGANYRSSGWYRPHDNALMRNLNEEPGSVTREALVLSYYGKVGMIEAATPTATTLTHTTQVPLSFALTLKSPSTSPALSVEWRVDNVLQAETSGTLSRLSKDIGNGTHTVKAIVRDPTTWVRRDPSALMVEEKTWTLKLSNQTDPAVINTPLPVSRVLPSGQTLSLDATATGPGPITYQWLKNNVPLKPAVTTSTLTVGPVTLASAGTYTVRIINPGYTVSHSCKLAVVDTLNLVSEVVVGQGRTATIAFSASSNLPPVSWFFAGSGSVLANGTHYANATTKALQIKNITPADTGSYTFTSGDYTTSPTIDLQVVTGKPDYTGQSLSLPTGIVAARYTQNVPLPANVLLTPNSYTASKLPRGLSLHPKSGLISGIPSVASVDQTLGDEVAFTVGNEFGKVVIKIRLLIKPLPPGIAGSFSGPVYLGSTLGSTTGGLMNCSVSSTGYYTGKAFIGTEALPFSGYVSTILPTDTTATGSFTLKPKHLNAALLLSFTINNALDADPTTANMAEDNNNFSIWRNRWVPPEAVDPFAGYHTYAFTASTNTNAPKGHGFGSVSIDSNGKTVVSGKLPDGSGFATTSHLSPQGSVFVYQTLYATTAKGSFIAIMDLDPGPPPVFSSSSSSNWFRPADTGSATIARTYKDGFGPENPLPVGGLYTPPAKTVIPMELAAPTGSPLKNAALSFQQIVGDDPLAVNADVTLNIKPGGATTVNTPNPKFTTFTLTPSDGRFKGSYTTKDADPRPPVPPALTRPAITRKVDYQGIIIRNGSVQTGFGYFLRDALPKADGSTTTTTSPKDSGPVYLQASP